MSKRRNTPNIPQREQQAKMPKNAVAEKVELLIGLQPDKETLNASTSDEIEKLDDLCNELLKLKKDLEDAQAEYDGKLKGIEKRESDVQAAEAKSLKDLEINDSKLATLRQKESALLAAEKSLLEREESIVVRESEASAGFVNQHREVVTSLTADLKQYRDQQIEALSRYQTEVLDSQQLLDAERTKLAASFKADLDSLAEQKAELHRALLDVQVQKDQLKIDKQIQEDWISKKRESLKAESAAQIASLEAELNKLKEFRQRDLDESKELQNRLADFAELQRMLKQKGLDTAEDLFAWLDQLQSELRDYKRRLSGRPTEDLEQRVEYLEQENRELEDQLLDKSQELQEANVERHLRAMGVLDREQLASKNRVLEQHNEALSLAIGQLKNEINGLKDMQRGQEVFPALLSMDRSLSEVQATESIPPLADFIDDLQIRIAQADSANPLHFDKTTLRLFVAGLSMSQLHILQGISGTGKTSLPKAFARAVGGTCTVVPVQAGWRDRDDLVGHYNAFEKRFYEKECLQALYRAQTPAFRDSFNIILLDEMNLSRPEQYFAEFLSAMELHGSDRQIVLMEDAPASVPSHLRDGRKIGIADNLWFVGTANHDETTFEFADKTQDRSFVLELGRNDGSPSKQTLKRPVTYSFTSMKEAFSNAIDQHSEQIHRIFAALKSHDLTTVLENRFGIGWGNRLERQARQFIPVVIAAGGSASEGLDHLLATRLMRDGKVTGRYDTKPEHLNKLYDCLEDVWPKAIGSGSPNLCLARLMQEIERKDSV